MTHDANNPNSFHVFGHKDVQAQQNVSSNSGSGSTIPNQQPTIPGLRDPHRTTAWGLVGLALWGGQFVALLVLLPIWGKLLLAPIAIATGCLWGWLLGKAIAADADVRALQVKFYMATGRRT